MKCSVQGETSKYYILCLYVGAPATIRSPCSSLQQYNTVAWCLTSKKNTYCTKQLVLKRRFVPNYIQGLIWLFACFSSSADYVLKLKLDNRVFSQKGKNYRNYIPHWICKDELSCFCCCSLNDRHYPCRWALDEQISSSPVLESYF